MFKFKAFNNRVEYEALVAGLEMAKYIGVWRVTCRTNSQLVVGQMNGDFQVKDDHRLQYIHRASALAKDFEKIEIWPSSRRQLPGGQAVKA